MKIRHAVTDDEILCTFAVMAQLRPHLLECDYLNRVRSQIDNAGYRLDYLIDDRTSNASVVAAAGYRISTNLAWGKFLYVDDLVTDAEIRSAGCGQVLLQHLIEIARKEECDEFHLDSGVQRFKAHRFYLKQGMDITSHHFALRL